MLGLQYTMILGLIRCPVMLIVHDKVGDFASLEFKISPYKKRRALALLCGAVSG